MAKIDSRLESRLPRLRQAYLAAIVVGLSCTGRLIAGDLSDVPLFPTAKRDSTRFTWGGSLSAGNITSFTKESTIVHSGTGAYQANLGSLPNGGFGFFQMFSSSLPSDPAYRQDRDLTQYSSLGGYVRNDTSVPLTFSLEIKDYRDSNSERATRSFTIPARQLYGRRSAPGAGFEATAGP